MNVVCFDPRVSKRVPVEKRFAVNESQALYIRGRQMEKEEENRIGPQRFRGYSVVVSES